MREPGRRSRLRRLPSLISPFSRAPTPAGCATSGTRAVDTRGAETLRVWAAGVENILRERHARVGPGADVDPPHYSKLSGF
jgi:hypothetical protein